MANEDVWSVTHVYEMRDKRMYNRYHYLEQGDMPLEVPAETLGRLWLEQFFPLIQLAWGAYCHNLYVYTRRVRGGSDIPFLREDATPGDRTAHCLPPASTVRFTMYAHANQTIRRRTVRLSGLANDLAEEGALTGLGASLCEDIVNASMLPILDAPPGGSGWYPGILDSFGTWWDAASVQARTALGSQRSRVRKPGARG